MYTVYKLTHTPTKQVYVGMTSKSVYVRFGQHFAESDRRGLKLYVVMKHSQVSDWQIDILKTVETEREARDCELYHIQLWDLYNSGLNARTGGPKGSRSRKDAAQRMSAYRKANPEPWNKGRKGVSDETRELMSLAKLRNPTRRTYTAEQKDYLARKFGTEVLCLETGIIFSSISGAAQFHSLNRESVRDVVNGRRNHTSGKVFIKI